MRNLTPPVDSEATWFGRSVACSGNTILIGSKKTEYVFSTVGTPQGSFTLPGDVSSLATVAMEMDSSAVVIAAKDNATHYLILVRFFKIPHLRDISKNIQIGCVAL